MICSSAEYRGGAQTQTISDILALVEEKVLRNTRWVLEESAAHKIMPREAAMRLALGRLEQVMALRRWSIY